MLARFDWFIAGPGFNPDQLKLLQCLRDVFNLHKLTTYCALLDSEHEPVASDPSRTADVFNENVEAMNRSDHMLAVLDWEGSGKYQLWNYLGERVRLPDTGTVWELGYFHAQAGRIVGYSKDLGRLNVMLTQPCVGFCTSCGQLDDYLRRGQRVEDLSQWTGKQQ